MATETMDGLLSFTESKTTGGNYFVSNYPPYSFWTPTQLGAFFSTLERPPETQVPLGIYIHIPFCRKRCHFCYFKVYTNKKAVEIQGHLQSIINELAIYSQKPFTGARKPSFIYFGGGTPSYLSTTQLTTLATEMKKIFPWEKAEEITFECEPGTLTQKKIQVIKKIGVTRLSLGVEHFDNHVLEINGRAHRSAEIFRAYEYARTASFSQINIDLIAGMVGETEKKWQETVKQALLLEPDSLTVYQMEVPYNTAIYKTMKLSGKKIAPIADWPTKRGWTNYAFEEFEKAGYTVNSGYTAVRNPSRTRFVYRDQLWKGADLIGVGVASFGHIQGIHYQNEQNFESYDKKIATREVPAYKTLALTQEERLIRELILQLKLGHVSRCYFQKKFQIEIYQRFSRQLHLLRKAGLLNWDKENLTLTRLGLLQVDFILPEFFLPRHRNAGNTL